jgi:phosphatidylglycerophosphate synthase
MKVDRRRGMNRSEYLTIPNGLSLSRIVLLPILYVLVLQDMTLEFTIAYALLGSTDWLDGLAARGLNQRTKFGKALDSIADLPFYISSAYFLNRLYPEYIEPNYNPLIVFFTLLGLSFVVSAVKCGKPIMMHTFLLKLNGVLVYFCVVGSFFFDTTRLITVILVIYFIGFTEEIFIFLKHGEVDPDSPSIFRILPK